MLCKIYAILRIEWTKLYTIDLLNKKIRLLRITCQFDCAISFFCVFSNINNIVSFYTPSENEFEAERAGYARELILAELKGIVSSIKAIQDSVELLKNEGSFNDSNPKYIGAIPESSRRLMTEISKFMIIKEV